jgi:hypothetical protein
MTIIKTNLITAFLCRIDNKKNVIVINGRRLVGGWNCESKATTMVIEFREPIKWLDITVDNLGYTGTISAEGLGVNIKDLISLMPNIRMFTYRINLPEQVKGKITFTGSGGNGKFTILNVSGFEEVK